MAAVPESAFVKHSGRRALPKSGDASLPDVLGLNRS